jgi:hypothetical protein
LRLCAKSLVLNASQSFHSSRACVYLANNLINRSIRIISLTFLSFDHEKFQWEISSAILLKVKPSSISQGTFKRGPSSCHWHVYRHMKLPTGKEYFQAISLISRAFVDIVYDHFLANDPDEFNEETLRNFRKSICDTRQHIEYLPGAFRECFRTWNRKLAIELSHQIERNQFLWVGRRASVSASRKLPVSCSGKL